MSGVHWGQAFESSLDYTNQIYKNKDIAIINKRPTPVKVLRARGNIITSAVYDKKSTVDYDGIYEGKPIVFEAKSTKESRLPLSMVSDHQSKYLKKADMHGAISFLIVEMRSTREVYLVLSTMLQKYIDGAKKGGRKSIPLSDMEKDAHLVETDNGVPLDYLSVVDRLIEK